MTRDTSRIAARGAPEDITMSVIGIGRVGLPLALSFADAGLRVFGVDRNQEHVDVINSGVLPFIEHGAGPLLKDGLATGRFVASTDSAGSVSVSDVVVLTVGTPLNTDMRSDTSQLVAALAEIGPSLQPGTLVITRSTISPGTTDRVVIPTLERLSGLKVGEDLFVAFCPERIAEGKAVEELRELPEIIGGADSESGELAAGMFRLLNPEKQLHLTDPLSAELAKLYTNVYRYVNFALANEYALIAEHYERDAHHIIRMLRDGYQRAPIPLPGPAGGPCLSKDGYFLIEELTFPDFVLTAWKMNDSVPAHLVQRLRDALRQKEKDLDGLKVAVLGQAFKADIDDDRLSPARHVIEMLQKYGAVVVVHDPYLSDVELDTALRDAEAVVLATNHSVYYGLDMKRLKDLVAPGCVIVDAWSVFDPAQAETLDIELHTFGRG
ncbi:MAG: nucleotide sugar dehydrogenase [Actinobacteria bacterium]|nr:nucleotide sugar dehydrogenase [Actinomycetota bacterium]